MRGLGMASSLWYNTGSAGAEILVKIHKDGRVEAFSGGQDIGTGIRTLIAQVVAEELGIPLPLIHVHIGDTQHPYAPGSGGSKTTPCVTPAARKAAFLAKQKLFDLARTLLKLDPKTPMLAQQRTHLRQRRPQKVRRLGATYTLPSPTASSASKPHATTTTPHTTTLSQVSNSPKSKSTHRPA